MPRPTQCTICDALPPGELVELDLILGDPARWPATLFDAFGGPPEGALPVSYRRFGAMSMGLDWLAAHGYEGRFTKGNLRTHLRYDVPVLEVNIDELVARGVIGKANHRTSRTLVAGEAIDPLAYVGFYNEGIKLGRRGLELMGQRVDELVERKEEVPLGLIKMIIDAGLKLATSQAAIVASGKRMGDDGDEDDAFRTGGDEQKPSGKLGHHRIRTIDGEARPIADQGPADRARYNDHAAETSGVKIGGQR